MSTTRFALVPAAVAGIALLAAVDGLLLAGPPPRPIQTSPCGALENLGIAASAIGLPSSGATVTSAIVVPASPQVLNPGRAAVLAIREYCKVTGFIAPVDPTAPRINFHVNMPTDWNGKIAQMGGSGTNGVIPVALTTGMQFGPESIPPDAPYALTRGFVVYGSDSGHQSSPAAGRRGGGPAAPAESTPTPRAAGGPPPATATSDWTLNQEAQHNLLYAQMKKTHDVTVKLVQVLYNRPIRHSYYLGSSQGGREALIVAQRFPQDYDGVFAQVPILPYTHLTVFDGFYRAKSQLGDRWVPPSKVPLIASEVRRQCDGLDGLEDGLISNYMACDRRFDPSVTPNPLAALRCPDGQDAGDACLSDAQIGAVNAVHGPVRFPFPIYGGWTSMPGWPTGSESASNWKGLAVRPDANSPLTGNLALIVKDPKATLSSVRLEDYRQQIQDFSALGDATDPDLSAFHRRGGKLIIKVNTTDYTANPRWSYAYHDKVVETMGQPIADQFLRLYVAVGIFHGRNIGRNPLTNEPVPSYVDFIAMLDDWVETGTAPADRQVLVDMETAPPFAVRASRPMCRYPTYPHYKGSGDPKVAASYTCERP